uniref:NOP protein chaperone 1 n=1 Tax=Jaculus jaculus TaxID=51337 RepID=A0A8C5LEU3_JACJA|nr:NOP protein chaperone 1 [Jaculus jaculus]
MEVGSEEPCCSSASTSSGASSGVSVSKELLSVGSEGRGGLWDKLLINSKPDPKKTSTLQTFRIQRSPLLDQVQTFLPQMAEANEKLRREMAIAPPDSFNIENTDGNPGKVIQMDVALIEMNQSDSKEEDSSTESSQDSSEDSSDSDDEVTIENIKLPNSDAGKGKIEVLDGPPHKKKKQ